MFPACPGKGRVFHALIALSAKISKRAPTPEFDGHRRSQMRRCSMLIDQRGRLRSAVAVDDVEIASGDAMLAQGAFESSGAVHRFGCVISHLFILPPERVLDLGQEVCNLRVRQKAEDWP